MSYSPSLTGLLLCVRTSLPARLSRIFFVLAALVLVSSSAFGQMFGDGSDGPLTVVGTVDLVADMNFTDLTIDPGGVLETHGFIVRVSGTLTNNGTITDSYSGGDGGAGGSAGIRGRNFDGHIAPTTGGNGVFGVAGAFPAAGNGGRGGGGGGGGGGAWDDTNNEAANGGNGGAGGIGGKGGGWVRIYANNFANNSVIHANGKPGLQGGGGSAGSKVSYTVALLVNRDMAGGGGGGGGGGAGGAGGTVEVVFGTLISVGSIAANGGPAASGKFGGGYFATQYNAGSNQNEESGRSGGSPNGGSGGRSEVSSTQSQGGNAGGPGVNGTPGTTSLSQLVICYTDNDGDGFGDAGDPGTEVVGGCGAGFVEDNSDCDDTDAAVNPTAVEVCDGIDNDCDGQIDINAVDATTWYVDNDGDGFGSPSSSQESCIQPPGFVDNDLDCFDGDASVNPAAVEVCDGVDNNCDGQIDIDAVDAPVWYADSDDDGFGDPTNFQQSCDPLPGFVADNSDCNDTDASINPSADEICDGVDNNCDGSIDVDAIDAATWFADDDGDGYGDVTNSQASCTQPVGFVDNSLDCDDTDANISPEGIEILDDGIDQDCDGSDASCCVGLSGNVNCDVSDVTDIADLTVLIDHLFISFPTLCCAPEANVSGDLGGVVDIADLTALIDHLFITFPPTAPCQ